MDWDATAAMGILSELKQCREDLQRNPSCSKIPMAFENIHVNRYDHSIGKWIFPKLKNKFHGQINIISYVVIV